MLTAGLLCWLGAGLWMLSNDSVARRVLARTPASAMRRALRAVGIAALAGSALPLAGSLGIALALAAAPLAAMSALSVAVVAAPLAPRLFAASLPAALAVLAALPFLG